MPAHGGAARHAAPRLRALEGGATRRPRRYSVRLAPQGARQLAASSSPLAAARAPFPSPSPLCPVGSSAHARAAHTQKAKQSKRCSLPQERGSTNYGAAATGGAAAEEEEEKEDAAVGSECDTEE